ncbi:nucleotidyltransferase family protein [Chloroflexota bacterium]
MKCLILAGGFGTRLYPYTINRAKGLLEYRGKPLLTHIIDRIPHGMDILVTCNRKFEDDFYQWQRNLNRQVELCVEDVWTEEQRKGAVSSLNFWVNNRNITQDLLVIAGDNYFEYDLAEFIAAYNGRNTLVAVYDIGDKSKANHFGVVRLKQNKIVEFQEKPTRAKSSLIATACYICPPQIFPLLSQYCSEGKRDNLGNFIAYLLDTDEVHAYTFTELWVDIGSPDNYRKLE